MTQQEIINASKLIAECMGLIYLPFSAEKERDYEILTVNPPLKHSGTLLKSDIISWTHCSKEMEFWNIHSVKRLSDGEIFTLGDNLVYSDSCLLKITSFECENHIILINTDNGGFYFLKDAEKVKPVLFTTFDGVEVFEGDTYFSLSPSLEIFCFTAFSKDEFGKDSIIFSTKIAAKNYKEQNEKKYSLSDIEKVLTFYTDDAPASYIKKQILKDLKNGN